MFTCHAQVTRFGIPLFDCTVYSITMSLYDTLCEVFLKKKHVNTSVHGDKDNTAWFVRKTKITTTAVTTGVFLQTT